MNESMPSSAQPPQEAQNPRTWLGVRRTFSTGGVIRGKATHFTNSVTRLQGFPRDVALVIWSKFGGLSESGNSGGRRRNDIRGAGGAAREPGCDRRRIPGRAEGAAHRSTAGWTRERGAAAFAGREFERACVGC